MEKRLNFIPQALLPWVVCFSAALFFAYELMQFHMLNAISPMLMQDLNLGAAKFSYLCSTYLLADVIFLLPAGIILDRFSVRGVILTALALCILGTFGFALSQTFVQASICHFLSGIGNAFCFLSCMMLVSRWFPESKQASIMGLMVTVGLLGGVVAQAPFSALAQAFTWRQALMIDAFIGVGIFALVYTFVFDKEKRQVEGETLTSFLSGLRQSIFNKQNICCGLYTGLMNLPLMIIGAVWGSMFLTQVHKIELSTASFIVSMICMGTIVGSPVFGYISDRVKRRTPLMLFGAAISLALFAIILMIPLPTVPMLLILFFMLGFFTSSQVLGYPTITESNPPHLTGTSMAVAAVIIMGLPMFLQPLTGILIELGWDGTKVDNMAIYSLKDYLAGFSIFPAGFLLSYLLARFINDPKVAEAELIEEPEMALE